MKRKPMDPIKLQQLLQLTFSDQQLLKTAFTHSSFVNEHKKTNTEDNERLEFLGDAVLEVVVSEYLYNLYPEMKEGEMTKLRASIVCEASLMKFAEQLHFGDYVLLGKGEQLGGGRTRPALLADVFEAFIGALFLDQGLDATKQFLSAHLFRYLSNDETGVDDYKTSLQERVQHASLGTLEYRIVEEIGPAHDRLFASEVVLNGERLGYGRGKSKKEAEQQAAAQALTMERL